MANIDSISVNDNKINVNLKLSKKEYEIIKNSLGDDVIILPSSNNSLSTRLTTGRIGNGNRLMLPNKFLQRNGVEKLEKKVPANAFKVNGDTFLLIKLKSLIKIPSFE